MSEFGVSDSPCNTSTKNECGVNLHYVKVGLSRRVREGPSVVLGGIFSAVHVDGHGRLVVVVFTEMIHFKFWDRSLAHEAYHMSFEASQF